jgi:hypothetical protein
VNFDSERRKRRFERTKKQRGRERRYLSFKQARERQQRLDRLVSMGVIG